MSNVLPAVVEILKADATLTALVGARIYGDFMPEDIQKPAVLAYITSETAENCFDGFRLEAYGLTRESSDEVIEAARQSLNGVLGTYAGTPIKGVAQATGKIHLVDIPNDGTDRWQFRTAQSFEIAYNTF
jgi:hypothetical protein